MMNAKLLPVLLLFLLSFLAWSGPVVIDFQTPSLTGAPGETLTYQGSLTNLLGSDYLIGAGITLLGFDPADYDLTPFLVNAPLILDDTSPTAVFGFFTVTIPLGFASGIYTGDFIVQGGTAPDSDQFLGSATFQVQVDGSPHADVPEPGWMLLVGLILLAIGHGRRRRGLAGVVTIAALAGTPLPAQMPTYQWHAFYNVSETGWRGGSGRAVATDPAGNIYVVGTTTKPQSFAPGAPLHAVEANPYPWVGFIMKLSPSGQQVIWYTFYHVSPTAIAVDPDGHIVVAGQGRFDGDGITQWVHHADAGWGSQAFVLTMTPQGAPLWAGTYGNGAAANDVAIDPVSRNIYVTGAATLHHYYYGWVGGWPGDPIESPTAASSAAPFVLALSSSGAYLWHTIPGIGTGNGVAVDGAGNVVFTGAWDGDFVAKLYGPAAASLFGSLAWVRKWGSNRAGYDVAADNAGNVYATGQAFATNYPAGCVPLHPVSGNPPAFVVKFSPNGECLWYTLYGGDDYDSAGTGIVVDSSGGVYVAGDDGAWGFLGDGGAPSLHANSQPGQPNGGHFVLALQNSGAYRWHTFYGPWQYHAVTGITIDSNRNLVLTGGSGIPWSGDNNAMPILPWGGGDALWVQKFALKTTPVITWANPADITFGSALGTAQLNATASVAGTFVYSPGPGTVLPVGNAQSLSVTFTPFDTANYNGASKSVAINVNAAAPPPLGAARLVVTRALSRSGAQVVLTLNVTNTGNAGAQNVQLTIGKIGTTAGMPLPQPLGTIAAGASVTTHLVFPGTVGNPGALSTLSLGGTYTGGSFSNAGRVTLP